MQGRDPYSKVGLMIWISNVKIQYVKYSLCLRQENRTCVLLLFCVLLLGVGWGGVGGHVNVPCTSCIIYCHIAKMSGYVCYVTCCYVAEISGIFYYVTCCYAADGVGWGGVGWGGGAC